MKDDRAFLIFILERIERIEHYTAGGRARFLAHILVQDGVLWNLQVVSESIQRLSDAAKAQHPEINWARIAGFRNVLVHNYLGIQLDRVWEVVEEEMPILKRAVQDLLGGVNGEGDGCAFMD